MGKVNEESKPGYFLDRHGEWQMDRRKKVERRSAHTQADGDNRRQLLRRETDRELIDREHKAMIRDALDEFSAEHQKRHDD